ncbi:unnamed protein product [Phytomonas sp. Hart1]|nr:unnamed protein product [Phytomonas sp. Hart1]|eukprot:CCW68047.1 unnamed protein product [Phytomonas sp. isolate Hart1]
MEFCQTTLANYLSQRQSVDRLGNLVIALKLISGLRYLHRRGILHRDIKPSNVLLDFRCQHANIDGSSSSSLDAESDAEDTEEVSSGADACNLGRRNTVWREEVDAANHTTGALVPARQKAGLNYLLYPNGLWQGAIPSPTGEHPNMHTIFPFKAPFQDSYHETSRILAIQTDIIEPSYDDEAISSLLNTPHSNADELIMQNRRYLSAPQSTISSTVSVDASVSIEQSSIMEAEVRKTFKWLQRTLVQVRLSDFGLAKLVDHTRFRTMDTHYFDTMAVNTTGVGSPLYSSPEQLRGGACTAASDAFSLGILFAEMYILPKTTAERLDVLRNVREALSPSDEMLCAYPELSVVRDLTRSNSTERLSLVKAHNRLREHLYQLLEQLYKTHFSFKQKG